MNLSEKKLSELNFSELNFSKLTEIEGGSFFYDLGVGAHHLYHYVGDVISSGSCCQTWQRW
jgi:hypothetical protein